MGLCRPWRKKAEMMRGLGEVMGRRRRTIKRRHRVVGRSSQPSLKIRQQIAFFSNRKRRRLLWQNARSGRGARDNLEVGGSYLMCTPSVSPLFEEDPRKRQRPGGRIDIIVDCK